MRHLIWIGLLAAAPCGAQTPMRAAERAPFFPTADSAAVAHLLDRLAFGARPGDIARIQRQGIAAWLDAQLTPERIPDASRDLVRRAYPAAFLSPDESQRMYPPPTPEQQAENARRQEAREARRDSMPMRGGRRDSMMDGPGRGYRELGGQVMLATLTRHVVSERQVLEVMTDFWTNHFNVFMGKQAARWLIADYVESAIRPNALGRFEDLLIAVARHPAMLVYLDNAMSIAPGASPPMPGRAGRRRLRPPPPQLQQRRPTGINENYARELLELHTLGVDAGYTQADVQNVARVLTGWSVGGRGPGGRGDGEIRFEFREWAHDRGAKTVLGESFPAGRGMDEGVRLLRMLAAHPATMRHLAHKLCARLVADEPPDGCVDRAVGAYQRSGGMIRDVVRAIVASEDFWAAQHRGAKVKSPLEFFVSALRATGARPDTTLRAVFALQQLGQPLFMQSVPTGYPERSEDWVNSGALLARMNVAVAIASGRLPGIVSGLDGAVPLTPDPDLLIAQANALVLSGRAGENTLRVVRQQIEGIRDQAGARAFAVGLMLGSPEFQRQ